MLFGCNLSEHLANIYALLQRLVSTKSIFGSF